VRAAGLFSWILDEKRRRYSLIFHEIMVYKPWELCYTL
jgi:hypothetical protein